MPINSTNREITCRRVRSIRSLPGSPRGQIAASRRRSYFCKRTQQLDQGAILAHHGLEILTNDQRWEAVHRVTPQLIDDLEQYDLPDYAQKIRQWYAQIEARHPKQIGNLPLQTSAPSLNLPTHCEGCGAPLRPAEVQKLDAHTVECAYCGSPIKV
jgi:hypothetical protein